MKKDGHDSSTSTSESESPPLFATYLFARHQFDKPYKVMFGLEKPSVVIRPNPNLFQLPSQAKTNCKENLNQDNGHSNSLSLPYRSIFAVLTGDSVLIYDTYHSRPLCIARGLHYAGLTDCSWTSDGKHLVVCSTDGYISIVSFDDGELGELYHDHTPRSAMSNNTAESMEMATLPTQSKSKSTISNGSKVTLPNRAPLPPCEPGNSALIAPPTKKARTMEHSLTEVKTNVLEVRKKKKVTPTMVVAPVAKDDENNQSLSHVQQADNDSLQKTDTGGCTSEKDVVGGVTKLSLNNPSQASC